MVNYKAGILVCITIIIFLYDNCIVNAKSYKLKDIEKLMLENDIAVKAVQQRLKETKGRLYEIRSRFGPELTSQYTYYPYEERTGDEEINTNHRFSLRLRQDIVQLLKIKPGLIKAMEAEEEGTEADIREAERRALYELRKKYLEILGERIKANFYLQLKNILQNLFALQKKRYRYKELPLVYMLKAEMDLIQTKDTFLYHQNSFERKRRFLAEFLGINAEDIEIGEFEPSYSIPAEDKIIAAALKNRGEIKRYEENARRERAAASIVAYQDIKMSSYIGYLMRRDNAWRSRSSPEIGLAFSIPLAFKKIKDNRYSRFKAKENYWKLEAQRIAEKIKNDIRKANERYLQQSARLLRTEKELELKREEMRIEQSKRENAIRTVKIDPADLFKIEADYTRIDLEKNIARHEKNKIYYELLYLAGLYWPEEFLPYHFKDVKQSRKFYTKTYHRFLWVWNVKEILKDGRSKAFFVSFCKIKGIKKVFVSINKSLSDSLSQNSDLPELIIKLHQEDIKVSALFGENLWIYPKHRKNLIKSVGNVLAYNTSNTNSARFDDIHLDIEPHTLIEGDGEKGELLNPLLKMLVGTFVEVKEIISAGKTELRLEVDIPAFYDNSDVSIVKKIFEAVDVITVMAYERKSPEELIKSVKEEIKTGSKMNKKVIIGINAKDFSDEANLEKLIEDAGKRLSGNSSFIGFSIHDYNDYRSLATR